MHGRAAHAGLEPQKGINAAVEAAHQVLTLANLGAPTGSVDAGRGGLGLATVTPTLLSAGSARNTVPALARCRWTCACRPGHRRTGSTS